MTSLPRSSAPALSTAAALELDWRRQARKDLLAFTTYTYRRYKPEPVHALIACFLNQVVAGTIRRLMILAPPQHGKSELTSVRLPAYYLAQHSDDLIILASYAAALAESKSRQARAVIESADYRRLYPEITTRRDSRAVNHWQLAGHRGGLLAVGVGGPITGHGTPLGIIDDPVENWEQAQSKTYRDSRWEWYRSTFRTRVWEGGAIVLIMTRWHEDDLAGRLLAEQADAWTVLRLPAVAETQEERNKAHERMGLPQGQPDPLGRAPGEPLSPGRYSAQALAELKRDVGSRVWQAEYQGAPSPLEGSRLKRSWFQIVEAAPAEGVSWCRYWDRAATAGDGDYSVGVLMGRDAQGVYWIKDVVRGQWESAERDRVIVQTAALDGVEVPIRFEQEPGSSGVDSARALIKRLAGYNVRADRVTGDKGVRAEPLAAQAEAGNVRLIRGRWNAAWLDEIAAYPNGANDDQLDATSGAFNQLAQIRSYRPL